MHVHPPDQTKQCNGTCGLSKPQSNYADRQWRKKEKGERILVDGAEEGGGNRRGTWATA